MDQTFNLKVFLYFKAVFLVLLNIYDKSFYKGKSKNELIFSCAVVFETCIFVVDYDTCIHTVMGIDIVT